MNVKIYEYFDVLFLSSQPFPFGYFDLCFYFRDPMIQNQILL